MQRNVAGDCGIPFSLVIYLRNQIFILCWYRKLGGSLWWKGKVFRIGMVWRNL